MKTGIVEINVLPMGVVVPLMRDIQASINSSCVKKNWKERKIKNSKTSIQYTFFDLNQIFFN